ncbi:MAG TPA: hypothetical protein VGN01_09295 [Acidobacteriaceae bacterium]|jgi:hypothetical protein
MFPKLIGFALLIAPFSCAAQQSSLTVEEVLAHARDNVSDFQKSIPAFIADESVLSERFESAVLKDRMNIESSFQVKRTSPDDSTHETRQVRLVNGIPPKDPHKIQPPWTFSGGFANVISFVNSKCDDFRLAQPPDARTIVVLANPKPAAADRPASCSAESYTLKAVIDPATFQIIHLEQTTQDAVLKLPMAAHLPFMESFPESRNNVLSWAVDYAPVELGGKTFWLAKSVTSDFQDKKQKKPVHLHYEARYSNYHRFTSTSTILPTQ